MEPKMIQNRIQNFKYLQAILTSLILTDFEGFFCSKWKFLLNNRSTKIRLHNNIGPIVYRPMTKVNKTLGGIIALYCQRSVNHIALELFFDQGRLDSLQ